jgi:hypothetical protein
VIWWWKRRTARVVVVQWLMMSNCMQSLKNFLRDPIARERVRALCMPTRTEPCPADAPCDDIGPCGVNIFHFDTSVVVFFPCFLAICRLPLSFALLCSHSAMASSSSSLEIPSSILIVGSGAFGLSTAWALCRNTQYKDTAITVVDRQPFPTPDGSSVRLDFA